MIRKMKYFIRRPWATQLALNNKEQIRDHAPLSYLIKTFMYPDSVVCDAMCWADTPQNHAYWLTIARGNDNY